MVGVWFGWVGGEGQGQGGGGPFFGDWGFGSWEGVGADVRVGLVEKLVVD